MKSPALTFEQLIGIAPEVYLAGEIDYKRLTEVVATMEGYVHQRQGQILAMSQELERLALLELNDSVIDQRINLITGLNELTGNGPSALFTLMTHGSHADACLGVFDLVKNLEAADITVYVRAQGMCYGAATVILTAAHPSRRYATKNTMFSIDIGFHQVGFCAKGPPPGGSLSHRLLELYYNGCALSRQEILDISVQPFGVEKALDYGLIEHVVGHE